MEGKNLRHLGLMSDSDFRAKATFGVALTALGLILPIAVLNFIEGRNFIALGALGIVALLACSAWLVYQGRCHQSLTLYCLLPAGMLFMNSVFQYDGIIGSLWCYPVIIAFYCMLSERKAWLANVCILLLSMPMVVISLPLVYSLRVGMTLLAISLFSAILVRVIDRLTRQLQYQLIRDPLTGLFNRMTLKDKLEQCIIRYEKQNVASSLLAIDIDHFKLINDCHGHDIGDKALVELSTIFKTGLRIDDFAFRTGGEEFLVVLNGSEEKEANTIAERIRREIEMATIIPDHAVTISVGVAQLHTDENWAQWMKRADSHLLDAKRLGRNRVTIASKPALVSITGVNCTTAITGTGA